MTKAHKSGQKTVAVVGGGPGGYVAAIRAAQLGAEVTLIEKGRLGGTCLNVGCIPTKCLLHSAELLEELRERGGAMGIKAKEIELDFRQAMAHKDSITRQLSSGIAGLLSMNKVTTIPGTAAFTAPGKLEVTRPDGGRAAVAADGVILAVGSVNAQAPIPGLKENVSCIDSTEALRLERPPKSMVIIGGGVIGLELACAYAAFGTEITVLEALEGMLPMLDSDLTKIGAAHMERMGVEFHLECPVERVEPCAGGARVVCRQKNGKTAAFEAEKVLAAIGRGPNTERLNLEAGGVRHEQGRIIVNERMETSVPGVYAVGDCVLGHAQLAHAASAMGETAAENICGLNAVYEGKTCPNCVYIMPEAASVGLTEKQARAAGMEYKVGRFPLSANGKALILNGGEGMVKVLLGKKYGELLGMQIIGPRASDLIAEGALAIGMEATSDEILAAIHSHPTVTEAVREAVLQAEGRAIHTKNCAGIKL